MSIISRPIFRDLQFFRNRNSFHRTRQACNQAHPSVTGGGEQVKERRAVIREDALLQRELATKTNHTGGTCGACQAGDLCAWTTFHGPFCFTITRLSLCDTTFTPSAEAVLISNV